MTRGEMSRCLPGQGRKGLLMSRLAAGNSDAIVQKESPKKSGRDRARLAKPQQVLPLDGWWWLR